MRIGIVMNIIERFVFYYSKRIYSNKIYVKITMELNTFSTDLIHALISFLLSILNIKKRNKKQ